MQAIRDCFARNTAIRVGETGDLAFPNGEWRITVPEFLLRFVGNAVVKDASLGI